MSNSSFTKPLKLLARHRSVLWGVILLFIVSFCGSLFIYYVVEASSDHKEFWHQIANFFMNIAQFIMGTILIGGGLGTIFNFIVEEMKSKEETVKEKWKKRQEDREKNKLFRWDMQRSLQGAHDNVELARILIRSHRSSKTYGEQIRNRIIPSLISLQDFRRRLSHAEDRELINDMNHLLVSLSYMIAYLTVLIEEFENNYLEISNLQHYQDALTNRMRTVFTEVTEGKKTDEVTLEKKKKFLNSVEDLFGAVEVPAKIEMVWQAMESLQYIWDFIDHLRDTKGNRTLYTRYFLNHYFNCLIILQDNQRDGNPDITQSKAFQANLIELERIETKRASDEPLTRQDSLVRKIMADELSFDFTTHRRKEEEE